MKLKNDVTNYWKGQINFNFDEYIFFYYHCFYVEPGSLAAAIILEIIKLRERAFSIYFLGKKGEILAVNG